MKWFAAALLAALLLLQYRIWFSGDGVREVLRLRAAVAGQQRDNERLSARNRQLAAEVRDLKQGYSALEERARSDLGMIGADETFFQVGAGEAPQAIAPVESAAPSVNPAPVASPVAPGTPRRARPPVPRSPLPPARTAAAR
jgi:cell division protein FtsB